MGEVFLGPATSIDREEEREKLENKLRIAERKGQKEKLKVPPLLHTVLPFNASASQKIRRRLAELRRESSSEFECGDFDGAIDGQGSSNSLLLTLPPNAVQVAQQLSGSIVNLNVTRPERFCHICLPRSLQGELPCGIANRSYPWRDSCSCEPCYCPLA